MNRAQLVLARFDAADTDEVLRVPAGAVPRDPEDRRMRWVALRAVLEALHDEHFDLVHVQTPFLAHYANLRFARERGIPVVETYHTFFEEYLHHYVPLLPRFIGRRLARGLTRAQCNAVDAVVAPSQPMADMLAEIGVRSALQVIPTGLPETRPLLLYVGRVAHEKNIEFLISSFLEVRRARPAALLVIAGEGPARGALAAQVNRLGLDPAAGLQCACRPGATGCLCAGRHRPARRPGPRRALRCPGARLRPGLERRSHGGPVARVLRGTVRTR